MKKTSFAYLLPAAALVLLLFAGCAAGPEEGTNASDGTGTDAIQPGEIRTDVMGAAGEQPVDAEGSGVEPGAAEVSDAQTAPAGNNELNKEILGIDEIAESVNPADFNPTGLDGLDTLE